MDKFLKNEWSYLEKKLIVSTFFLSGVVIGFLIAPIKKGIYCGNNNHISIHKKKKYHN